MPRILKQFVLIIKKKLLPLCQFLGENTKPKSYTINYNGRPTFLNYFLCSGVDFFSLNLKLHVAIQSLQIMLTM